MLRRNPATSTTASLTARSLVTNSTATATTSSRTVVLLFDQRRHAAGGSGFETVSQNDIIESRNSMMGKLMAPRTPSDKTQGEVSWKTMRNQEAFFEVPVRFRHEHDWQRAREDWYSVETKLIWSAFDAPEKLPILMRDEVIRGHRSIFEDPKWIERAIYWTKEARYWRVLGISHPFYDRDTLRVYTWDDKGQAFGQPVINSAMRDAISDLERAKKRKDLGLEPNYIWDRWGPNGFIDGARSDYLPRFQYNPYSDPDGVDVEPDELNAITSHEQIRDRYKEFIWMEEGDNNKISTGNEDPEELAAANHAANPFEDSFTTMTNGYLEIHDFPEDVQKFYFDCHLGVMNNNFDTSSSSKQLEGSSSSSEKNVDEDEDVDEDENENDDDENDEGASSSRNVNSSSELTIRQLERRRDLEESLVQNTDDIRSLIYLSAQYDEVGPRFEEWYQQNVLKNSSNSSNDSADASTNNNNNNSDETQVAHSDGKNKWDHFKDFVTPLREACDAKVEACRLLHWSCREVDQAREYFSEKCGFVDFMMTSDKILTAASMSQLKTLQQLASNQEWGLPLCLALTDKEKADAVGIEAYSIWREFEDLCIDRRRRMFTQRHAAPASEEKSLDFLLQQFAKRPKRDGAAKGSVGSEFDRENEPIGRSVQRRVLASDVMDRSKVDKDADAAAKAAKAAKGRTAQRKVQAYDALRANQFAGHTF